jgi:glycerol-3-phosphate dehydrogenase (NAD(P)+)
MKISVLGAGSFGTTLANILAEKQYDVSIWTIEKNILDDINQNHKNTKYTAELKLSSNLKASMKLADMIKNTDYCLWAIPTQVIRKVWDENKDLFNKEMNHINVAKGLEAKTGSRISELFAEYDITEDRYCLLAGPSHAEELSLKQATAISAISKNQDLARSVQEMFSTDFLRIYTNQDLVGSELSGAFKNVVAIAAGVCDGAGLGDNAKAALITRSMVELKRLIAKFHGSDDTVNGLTGIGDLIATCTSLHSRNRFVGQEIGKGKNLDDILNNMVMVAEGVRTCEAFHKLAGDHKIEMPIVEATYRVMFESEPVSDMLTELMTRDNKEE